MRSRILNSTSDVLEALGGVAAVARLLGFSYTRVQNWQNSKTFPSNTYTTLTAELRKRRLSAPASLWGMVEKASA